MRAKNSVDFSAFGRAPTTSVVEDGMATRLLDDDAAIRAFGPGRALVTNRNVGASGAAGRKATAACGDGSSL
jgi:hypothetical protein